MSCIERGDFTQCMSEAYLGAEPVAIAAMPEPGTGATSEPEIAEPETAETQAAEPEAVEPEAVESEAVETQAPETAATEVVAPTFTLVRVEPDGSAVIAGYASPASEIQIFANGELLGSETTEPGGDFAYVTGDPLPSGGVELRLLDTASGAFATTSVVVIVQDDRTSEPLVVASEPGAASEILQGLETAPPAPVEADEPAEPAALAEEQVAVAQVSEPAALAETPAPAETVPTPTEAEAPAAAPVEEIVTVAQPAEPETTAAEVTIVPPTIDAVEIDGDRNFFAGGGTEGMAVRLYVENRAVGTTEVADGRWLVEAINVLNSQSQRIRADMIDENGVVVGRAEVDFVIDLPAQEVVEEEPVVVAEVPATPAPVVAPVPAPEPAVEAEVTPEPAAEPAPVAEPVTAPEPAPVEVPAVKPVPTMVGVSDGQRTTSGQVIIRRGDNLWTIARRVYGEGLRYTQIFEANASQIRNPDLIYPGQVFDLPGTDVVIGEQQ